MGLREFLEILNIFYNNWKGAAERSHGRPVAHADPNPYPARDPNRPRADRSLAVHQYCRQLDRL